MSYPMYRNRQAGMRPVNALFEDFFGNGFTQAMSSPKMNITEADDAFEIAFSAPGFTKGDFSISVDNNVLTVTGKHVEEAENPEAPAENKRYLKREFTKQRFERSFTLPQSVDVDAIEASCEHGILTVRVPKREEARAKSRSIEIR